MEERESNERKNLFIRTIILIILILLAFLSTILYVYLYPKTRVYLYDTDYTPIKSFEVKRYSNLESLPDNEKTGYTFKYWTYDDFELNGGTRLNKSAELTTAKVELYANYQANKYRVTYHIQYYDEATGQYLYKTWTPPRNTYPEIYEYGSKIDSMPTGRDAFGNLLSDFCNKPGYTFVGWTTKVISEDDPDVKKYLKYAGQEYVIDIPSDIDFYAYFEKNTYQVNMHTGIQYQLDASNKPKKDSSGEYIIKNITGDENNDSDSLIAGDNRVRYMDSLVEFVGRYSDIQLNENNAGMAYGEYEFKGWYLDEDYKLAIKDQELQLLITERGVPYYEYRLSDGSKQIIYAEDSGNTDDDDNPIYEFNLYSKWERKKYEIALNKNSNSASGKITPIYLYRVFLDDQGVIIDEYGNYYNDGDFTYEGYANGGHYARVNLETLDVVDETFRTSNKNYRLVGWTDSTNVQADDTTKYSWWQQEAWTKTLGENRQTGQITYDNPTYVQTLGEDVTLYAQWSKEYTIKFAYDTTTKNKYFEYKGIEKEWFILPTQAVIEQECGERWTKTYNYFAGWKTGTSALATKYLEYLNDGEVNPNYMFIVARTNVTLIAHWVKTSYSVNFYLNDNDDKTNGGAVFDTFYPVYGGTYKYYTSKVPTREGYIFDGWSEEDYATDEYSINLRENASGKKAYNSSSNFLVKGNQDFYASWTTDYEIEYNANGGEFGSSATTKYTYSVNGSGKMKINLYIGSGQKSITRANYKFVGWKIADASGNIGDDGALIKNSDTQKMTFDFYKDENGKCYYYKYKADGITVAQSEKTEMYLQNGRKVVLMAVWEPNKYSVTVKDTMASGDKSSTQITIQVAFNETFVFPDKNAQNVPFDNKIGYKLVGFAKTEGGAVEYAIGEDNSYPTIDAGVISKNTTFYTVYEQKNIRVEFKAKLPDGDIQDFTAYTINSIGYGAPLTMPTIPTITSNDSKILKFKYWYYEKDGEEIKIASGDKVTYHDENNVLVIYGHFEVDSYAITVGLTNPYVNQNLIVDRYSFSLGSFEKDSQITENLYRKTMHEVYSKLKEMLGSDCILDEQTVTVPEIDIETGDTIDKTYITKLVFKGFTMTGMYATGGYDNQFAVGKQFNTTDFKILGFTTSGMTIATNWSANNIDIVYHADETDSISPKTITVAFNDTPIDLENGSYLTIPSKEIKSWYIKLGGNNKFLDLSSRLVGNGSKYNFTKLYDLDEYIAWDSTNGKGVLNIYANTAQVCKIEYYTFANSRIPKYISTDSFVFDGTHTLLGADSAIVDTLVGSDLEFNGWYLGGDSSIKFAGSALATEVRSYFDDDNDYTIKLYADLTFDKSVYRLKVNGNVTSEEWISTDTISLLKNDGTNYYYITAIVIDDYPDLSSDQIPEGYDYYGLRNDNNTFTLAQINSRLATINISGYDIKLVTYFTKEYTITYTVIDGANFNDTDNTTTDKVEKYIIGIDGVVAGNNEIKINYTAEKTGYAWDGWRIKYENNTIGDVKYDLGQAFTPTTTQTLFVPAFQTPTDGTINAKIKLIREDGSSATITYSYLDDDDNLCVDMPTGTNVRRITNGYVLSFARVQSLLHGIWTEGTRDLYKWVDSDGNEYDATTGTFTIPSAIQNEDVFTFTGVWIEKYYVKFTQPQEFVSAEGYDLTPITIRKGEKYTLHKMPVIKVGGVIVEDIEFKYWKYNLDGQIITIKYNDAIVLNSDSYSGYKYLGNADGTGTHYLPALPTGSYEYELVGEWKTVTYDITLKVINPDDSHEYTLTLHDVPFGTTIGSRDMLDNNYIYLKKDGAITSDNASNLASILGLITDARGIIGWANTAGGSVDANALNSIKSAKTLYAVWQSKVALKFASANSAFGYTDDSKVADKYYLPTEKVDINNIVSYIYSKGYATVYLQNGTWIIYLDPTGYTEEYYYLSGFATTTAVKVNGSDTTTIQMTDDGRLPTFEMAESDVTLTPILTRIYRVNFWDNTTADGGSIVKNSDNTTTKYDVFVKAGRSLNLSAYNTTRLNFTFMGWNTNKDSDSYLDGISASDSDINLYAIWASNRHAKFQITLSSVAGINNKVLLDMPLTKDNKINTTTLENYLNGLDVSSSSVHVYGMLDKMTALSSHLAYTYNFNNYLLNGFVISKNGVSTLFDLTGLGAEDFGNASNYNQNEDIIITFSLDDIFRITYHSNAIGVNDIDRVDYFVVGDSTTGKLVEKTADNPSGIVSSITLPNVSVLTTAGVTQTHYTPAEWATDSIKSASTITYSMSNASQLNLSTYSLKVIGDYLRNKYSQEYALYIIWEYELIDIYVYASADIIDTTLPENAGKADTTLTSPYETYLNATSSSDIAFKNIPDILSINGHSILVGNYKYNYGAVPEIAQVRYNDTIEFTSSLNYTVGGYTLVGFSTTLYKLGEVVAESNYKKLNTEYVIDETIATGDKIVFYPVYTYDAKNITIYALNGGATIESGFAPKDSGGNILTSTTSGLVYLGSTATSSDTIASAQSKSYTVNIHTGIKITADNADAGYAFEKFTASITDTNAIIAGAERYIGNVNIPLLYNDENKSNSSYYYNVVYGATKVNVNLTIDYDGHGLKSGIIDNFVITFAGYDNAFNYNEKSLNRLNTTAQITSASNQNIYYYLTTASNYYTFELYSGGSIIELKEGTLIEVSKLDLSDDNYSSIDEAYNIDIVIKAIPKTNMVTFVMNRGALKAGTTLTAESSIYENVTSFAITGNIAKVYTGSVITLPTANDINYSKGKFIKFYLQGDSDKLQIINYTINQNLTFVEDFDDNAYTIQYYYNGNIEFVSGLTPNSLVKIGYLYDASNDVDKFANKIDTTKIGYTLDYWTFENGDKAFDDGQEIELTKSYILYAKYTGNPITFRYTYNGKSKDIDGINGADIVLLDPEKITDSGLSATEYIYGWKYVGAIDTGIFTTPNTLAFTEITSLGYEYSATNTIIVFEAEILGSYEYIVSYKMTDIETGFGAISNASSFDDEYFYVRQLPNDSYSESDLRVYITGIVPLVEGAGYFQEYEVEYSEDGINWEPTSIKLVAGGLLELATPIDGKTIRYRLTPKFSSNNSTIKVNFNLTHPSTGANINEFNTVDNVKVSTLITDLNFDAGLLFSDSYMLNMSATEGSNTATFTLDNFAWSIDFQLQLSNVDWFEYTLKGYTVSLYNGDAQVGADRQFLFGNALNGEDRNISGVTRAELTPIWEKKYVVSYLDRTDTLLTKQYIPYESDLSEITILAQSAVTGGDFALSEYACVGWTALTDNNHIISQNNQFVKFEGIVATSEFDSIRNLSLYPAQSKIYTLKFITYGIDESDEAKFELNTFGANALPKIYVGINETNSIELNNYYLGDGNYFDFADMSNLYSICDSAKYTFLGFANSTEGTADNKTYIFDENAIDNGEIKAYVVWQKNAYNIKFEFEAYENGGTTNLLGGYSFEANQNYGDKLDLSWDYDVNTAEFTMTGNDVVNADGLTLIEKINTILNECGIDYLSAIKFTHTVGGSTQPINVDTLFEVTNSDVIKVTFDTRVVRLTYNVYYGTVYNGTTIAENTELASIIIGLGSELTPEINISDLSYEGYVIDFWTSDGSTNFFPSGRHTITSSEIDNSKLNNKYRLPLYIHFNTAYKLNFYYFSSLSDLKANRYTKLGSTMDVTLGDTIGLYEMDDSGNYKYDSDFNPIKVYLPGSTTLQKTIFDDYFASLGDDGLVITINSATNETVKVKNFHELLTVFEGNQYTSEGEIKVNDAEYTYFALDLDGHSHSLYQVMTYAGADELVNNIYLTYEPINHKVKVSSIVGILDGTNVIYDSEIASKYAVYSEYATDMCQIENDNGEVGIDFENMRGLANVYADDGYYSENMNYMDTIYLISPTFAVRGGSGITDFVFQGWKVLVNDGGTITFRDLSEYGLTVRAIIDGDTGNTNYWEVSNILGDITLVAVYTEKLIDVNITLTTEDGLGELMNVAVITEYGSLANDYTTDTSVITRDNTNHTTTYNLKVLFNSQLTVNIPSDYSDSHQLRKIIIGTFETAYPIIIGVNEGNINATTNRIDISVIYAQLSYTLQIQSYVMVDGTRYNAELGEINYNLATVAELKSVSTVTKSQEDYNIQAEISAGAIIHNDTLGTPTINNFTFDGKWEYYHPDYNAWYSLADKASGIAINDIVNETFKQVQVRAVGFVANNVNIEYVYKKTVGENTVEINVTDRVDTELKTAKYGQTITLPWIIVEGEDFITTGYNRGNYGENLVVVDNHNNELSTLVLEFTKQGVYYVVFDVGDTGFAIPSSYPTTMGSSNKIASAKIEVPANTNYYHFIIGDGNQLSGAKHNNTTATVIIDNTYDIPNVEISAVGGVNFDSWVTRLNRTFDIGDTYDYRGGESRDGLITLTAVADNFINIKFYITNPASTGNTLKLTTDVNQSANLDYINILIGTDGNDNYVDVDYSQSGNGYLKIDSIASGAVDVSYFANMTNFNQFKFYGWATSKVNVFNNINSFLESSDNYSNGGSNYFSYYYSYVGANGGTIYAKSSASTIKNSLAQFIKATGQTEFYAVWEQKYSVSFVDTNGIIYHDETTGAELKDYYAQGDTITFPNTSNLTLTQTDKEWIGWQNKDNNANKVEFVNGSASITFIGTANQQWIPLWAEGYTLTLNMNFGSRRETVANVLSSYGITKQSILDNTGYPIFASQDDWVAYGTLVATGTNITIGSTTYSSAYKYTNSGKLWTVGAKANLSLLGNPFDGISGITIYPTNNASLNPSNATWLNSYYNFVGWATAEDATQSGYRLLTSEELSRYTITEDTTLYAIWDAITLSVYLAPNEMSATNNSISVSKTLLQVDNPADANNNASVIVASNPITVKFGEKFIVSNYETKSYYSQFSALTSDKEKRFSKWNVVSPMTQIVLDNPNFYIANDLYLYPEYIDCYKVVFKTTQSDAIFSAQYEDGDKYQRVVNGENVIIRDYIQNTLKQNINIINYVSYTDNDFNTQYLYKNGEKDWTTSLPFNSNNLTTQDRNNKEFTIYIDISFNVNLYAPNASGEYTKIDTLNITPEMDIIVFRQGLYSTGYGLDLATYNYVPDFEGWYFYDIHGLNAGQIASSIEKGKCYQMDDLANAIAKYQIKATADGYKIYTYDENDRLIIYNYDVSGNPIEGTILNGTEFNFYAKLTVTQTLSLGNDSDAYISNYAELLINTTGNYVDIIDTRYRNGNIKSTTIKFAYNSTQAVELIISTEGYVIKDITKNNTSLTYASDNDNYTDTQALASGTLNITKSSLTSKTVNDSITNGMFITYSLKFTNILDNNSVFNAYITPYVFDVAYKVVTNDGMLREKSNEDFDDGTASMISTDVIYMTTTSDGGVITGFESNQISMAYTIINDGEYTIITFKDVPYSATLTVYYMPQEEMLKHFAFLSFDWDSNVWQVEEDTHASISSTVSIIDEGKKIQFKPIEHDETCNEYTNTYTITANFENNKINAIELYIDHENTGDTNAWTNILDKINGVATTQGEGYTRYSVQYSADVKAGDTHAGDDLSSLFTSLRNTLHEAFDSNISPDSLGGDAGISLNKAMDYFWLNDNTPFKTYSTDKNQHSADGYLGGNIIYSYHNGTVKLHLDVDKAILVGATTRVKDYKIDGIIDGVDRADISLVNKGETSIIVYSNNSKINYENNTNVNSLQVKMPYSNSKIEFTTTPDIATADHVAYRMDEWKAIDEGTVQSGCVSGNKLTIDTTKNMSDVMDMFATFGIINKFKAPEIHLRGDVVATTYTLTFRNDDEKQIASYKVAYDKGIYDKNNSEYYYYSYTLDSMYTLSSASRDILPRFTPVAPDSYRVTFAHSSDGVNIKYGDLQYLFSHWATATSGNAYDENALLANRTESGGAYSYNNITLYAVYTACQKITIRMYTSSGEVDNDLYLSPLGFVDQFGNAYDKNLYNDNYTINTFLSNNGATMYNDKYVFYLKGTSNSTHVSVGSLAHIIDAYNDSNNSLAERNEYIVYPMKEIQLTVYKHSTDKSYNANNYSIIYQTLGGKIDIASSGNAKLSSDSLTLSNIIWNSTNETYWEGLAFSVGETISPESYSNYTFAFWWVNNINNYVLVDGSNSLSITNDENIKPHYNATFNILTSIMGSSSVVDGSGTSVNIASAINLLNAPSGKNITTDSHDLKVSIAFKFESSGTNSGYPYSVFKVINETTGQTLYTLSFATNATYFNQNNMAYQIVSADGVTKILKVGETYYVEDGCGSYQITPLAFPDNVKITVESGLVVTNLPDTTQYSNNMTLAIKPNGGKELEIAGGSNFIFGSSTAISKPWYKITFTDLLGKSIADTSITMTATDAFVTNNLQGYLTNFRWQYQSGSAWNDCPDDMIAMQTYTIRLACEWITYDVNFQTMKQSNIEKVTKAGTDTWDVKDTSFSGYYINSSLISGGKATLFKGETLEYNHAKSTFTLNSSISGRNNKTISIKLTGTGTIVGWVEINNGNNLGITGDKTFTAEDLGKANFAGLVAWAESTKTSTVKVGTLSGDFMTGYAKVEITIETPLGTSATTTLEIDKSEKVYGSAFTLGASSRIKFALERDDSLHHQLTGFKYDGNMQTITGAPASKTYEYASASEKITGSHLASDIYVYADAIRTASQYYIVDSQNKILNTYTIYGGYLVDYSLENKVLTGKIYDFWGNLDKTFAVYMATAGTNDTSANKFYPNAGYTISQLNGYNTSKITTTDGIISATLSETGQVATLSKIVKESIGYNGDGVKNILKYTEYVSSVTLNFYTKIGSSTASGAILNSDKDITKNLTFENISINEATFLLTNVCRKGVDIKISNVSKNTFTIPRYLINSNNVKENLDSVEIVEASTDATRTTFAYTDTSGDDRHESFTMATPVFNVIVHRTQTTETTLSFKLTLPLVSDFRNLKITTTKKETLPFNIKNSDTLATITIQVGSQVKVSEDGKTLTVTEGSESWTIKIEGDISSTSIYKYNGWYLDTIDHQMTKKSETIGGIGYALYAYDSSATEVKNTSATTVYEDTTLVLDIDRAPVNIYTDSSTWKNLLSGKYTITDTQAMENLANYNYSTSGKTSIQLPGGLFQFTPVDLSEETYVTGGNLTSYIGVDNSTQRLQAIDNTYREQKVTDSTQKVFAITNLATGNTISSVYGSKSFNYAGYLIKDLNHSNTTYDIELSTSNSWILVEYPAKLNTINVVYHSKEYGKTDDSTTTLEYSRLDSINLPTYRLSGTDTSITYYTYRNIQSRLYQSLNGAIGYDRKYVTFTSELAKAYLNKYNIKTSTGGTIADGVTGADLSKYSSYNEIHIYPAFTHAYVVTVKGPFGTNNAWTETNYDVIPGESFTFEYTLNSVQLTYNGYGEQAYFRTIQYTVDSTSYVLSSMQNADTGTTYCTLLSISGGVLTQPDNKLSISFVPTGDITIQAVGMNILGSGNGSGSGSGNILTKTYTCTNYYDYKTTNLKFFGNSPYGNTISFVYSNVPNGIDPVPQVSQFAIPYPDNSYFIVNESSINHSTKTFTINHTEHNWQYNGSATSSVGTCGTKTIYYYVCKYCNATDTEDGGTTYNHDFSKHTGYISLNDTQHYRYKKCSKCSTVDYTNKIINNHEYDYSDAYYTHISGTVEHLVTTTCDDCGYVNEKRENCSPYYTWTYTDLEDGQGHEWTSKCRLCGDTGGGIEYHNLKSGSKKTQSATCSNCYDIVTGTCVDCGATFEVSKTYKYVAHTIEYIYDSVSHEGNCSSCGQREVVPRENHKWMTDKKSTCNEEGEKHCTICSCEASISKSTKHNWKGGVDYISDDESYICSRERYEYEKCTVCGTYNLDFETSYVSSYSTPIFDARWASLYEDWDDFPGTNGVVRRGLIRSESTVKVGANGKAYIPRLVHNPWTTWNEGIILGSTVAGYGICGYCLKTLVKSLGGPWMLS